VLGRKHVALVDAEGIWLAIAVMPASVQYRDTLPVVDAGKVAGPSLRLAILDRAFRQALPGMVQPAWRKPRCRPT